MKKLSGTAFAFLALLLSLSLFACSFGGGDGGSNADGGGGIGDGAISDGGTDGGKTVIYKADTKLGIVFNDTAVDQDLINAVYSAAVPALDSSPSFLNDGDTPRDNEIVIGRSSRAVSVEAYNRLERIRYDDEWDSRDVLRYLVYSSGTSVAIAYDTNSEDIAADYIINYFIDNYMRGKSELKLREGTVARGTVYLPEFYQARDDAYIDELWAKLEAERGSELVAAFKEYYSLFSDDVIDWFANLYDPGEGGYYYASSARDKEGFLPDIESTSQALSFITNSGMLHRQPGGTTVYDMLPEGMKERIIYFLKVRQAPDGYFYHPQWESVGISRLSRDLMWASGMLKTMGVAPTYDTPNGYKGDGILADGTPVNAVAPTAYYLPSPLALGKEGVSALVSDNARIPSKVTLCADTVDAPLFLYRSAANFRYYLETGDKDGTGKVRDDWDINRNSYVIGNELAAQVQQIAAYDKVLTDAGDESIIDILTEWLNSHQDPKTGGWDTTPTSDPNFDPYENCNGLLKIICVYNDIKREMPNAVKACYTAIDAIFIEEKAPHVCAVYNTWFAVRCIKNNMANYGGKEGMKGIDEVVTYLRSIAPQAIRASASKMALFRHDDGSFSYVEGHPAQYSQNALVVPELVDEGDVNATIIGIAQTVGEIWDALGYGSYKVPSHTDADLHRYIRLLEDLQPVIKDEYVYVDPAINNDTYHGAGEYADVAETFDGKTVTKLTQSGAFTIIEGDQAWIPDDLTAQRSASVTKPFGDPALELIKSTTGDPWLLINSRDKQLWKNNDTYVFETDFCLISGSTPNETGNTIQFYTSTAKGTVNFWYDAAWVIWTDVDATGYWLRTSRPDENGSYLDMPIKAEDWYNFRFVIENASNLSTEACIISTYVNNTLVHQYTTAGKVTELGSMMIRQDWHAQDARCLFDNMFFSAVPENDEVYVDENTYLTPDSYEKGNGAYYEKSEKYDTTAGALAEAGFLSQFNTGKSDVAFDAAEGEYAKVSGGALEFGTTVTGDPFLNLINSVRGGTTPATDSYVFETDFMIESVTAPSSSGTYFMLYPNKIATEYAPANLWTSAAAFVGKTIYDELCFFMGGASDVKALLDFDTWYNIRIEIDDMRSSDITVRGFINGELLAEYKVGSGNCEIDCYSIRFSWNETKGKVFLDNTYFANYADGDAYDAPEYTELPAYNRGEGVYCDRGEGFDGKLASSLVGPLFSMLPSGKDGITFDGNAEGGVDYATVESVDGNDALHLATLRTGDPWLVVKNSLEGNTDITNDSYVFSADLRFDSFGLPGSSGQYFEFYFSREATGASLVYDYSLRIAYDAVAECYYIEKDGERFAVPMGEWFNLTTSAAWEPRRDLS